MVSRPFVVSYSLGGSALECAISLYVRLLLVHAMSFLTSFQLASFSNMTCLDENTTLIENHIDLASGRDFDIFQAFEDAQAELAQNWSSFALAQSFYNLRVSPIVFDPIPPDFSDFVTIESGLVCNSTNIFIVPERVDIASCALRCSTTPECGCMHYSIRGDGHCELAMGRDLPPIAGVHMQGYRYRPFRNIAWDQSVRYLTVPLLESRWCDEIFADSLSSQPTIDLRVFSDNTSCRYTTSGGWLTNGFIYPDQGLTLYGSGTQFTLYDYNYDVRARVGIPITFTRLRPRISFPLVQNASCASLFPSPVVDIYIRLNRGRSCRYIQSIQTWKSEALVAGEEFAFYFGGTSSVYIAQTPSF